jgi:tetratricopeptide (TPR) repeat protein
MTAQDSNKPEIWLNPRVALDLQFKVEEAEAIFRETVKRFPEYEFAQYNFGLLLGTHGRYKEAEETLLRLP